ncbi:hypothetical protein AWB78_08501 [Caballeronia calidae]|uniref:YDG domain-containing protein n=1 Tax=Caballeronia calidae TaxID=1777139 RepID=A0A158EKJ9_9BURK|nr:hypothetical protein AWB78_08501 [Caballeronia calidae]
MTVANKTYDATTSATVASTGSITGQTGAMTSDAVSLSGAALTAAFGSKNAGVETATLSGFTLTGADAGNYVIASKPSAATATIAQAQITVSGVTVANKTYDATTSATVASTGSITGQTGAMTGDAVSLSGAALTAAFGSKNAGVETATLSGFTLTGADAGNYVIASKPSAATATISQAQITVSGVTVANKTYDATTSATVASAGSITGQTGAMTSDAVSLSGAALTAAFGSKNAGVETATLSGFTLTGADAGNYVIASKPSAATATIAQAQLTLSGATVANKTYDATTSAEVASAGSLSGQTGAMRSDDLSVELSAVFNSKNAGVQTASLSNVTLTGADAGNYAVVLASPATSATIHPREVQVALGGIVSKTYDGTTNASLGADNLALAGVLGSDQVGLVGSQALYNNPSVGTGKLVTVSGLHLTGGDASNYVLSSGAVSATVGVIVAGAGTITPTPPDLGKLATQEQLQRANAEFEMLTRELIEEQTHQTWWEGQRLVQPALTNELTKEVISEMTNEVSSELNNVPKSSAMKQTASDQ